MIAYIIGIHGYEWNNVRYITLSDKKAKELFEVLREERIKECKEMIDHIKKESDCVWDIPNWEKDLQDITNMDYYDDGDMTCDRPYIERMVITE